MSQVLNAVTTAVRSLRRMPLLTGGAIATLSVAIGLNLAVFGLMHRALLSAPARVAEPDRVFTLSFGPPGETSPRSYLTSTSYVAFQAVRQGSAALASTAAFQRNAATLFCR